MAEKTKLERKYDDKNYFAKNTNEFDSTKHLNLCNFVLCIANFCELICVELVVYFRDETVVLRERRVTNRFSVKL